MNEKYCYTSLRQKLTTRPCVLSVKINHTDVDILSSQVKTPFSDHPTPPSQKEMDYLNQTIVIIPFSEVDLFFFLLQKKLPSSAF